MKQEVSARYPLDNSAIIHLASRRKNYTNEFRIVITLKEPVDVKVLQEAANRIALRFPTVVAGIRRGVFQYHVIPCKGSPHVRKESECLAPMSHKEIETCAFRILYGENRIVTEIFHSLTDGYGGMVVANTLAAEYLRLKYSVSLPFSEMALDTAQCADIEEMADDYLTFAGKKGTVPKQCKVYRLPGKAASPYRVRTVKRVYPTDAVQNAAHRYGVTVTVLLTGIMAASIMEIQNRQQAKAVKRKAVRIMVPVNLRRLFGSRTLRNFSLYALCCVKPREMENSFEELLHNIGGQLAKQATKEHMAAAMAMNAKATRFPLYRFMPLPIKSIILRLVHRLFGECSSCITLSNLGKISLPEDISRWMAETDFLLMPRIRSSYNCGIVSFNGRLSVNFTGFCPEPDLESVFFQKLEEILNVTG